MAPPVRKPESDDSTFPATVDAALIAGDVRAVQYCKLLTSLSSTEGDVSRVGLMRGDLDEDEPVDERTYQHRLARWERGHAVLRAGYKLRSTGAYGRSQGIPEPSGALSPLVITSGWERGTLVHYGLYLSR